MNIQLDVYDAIETYNLRKGMYKPLQGFMCEDEFELSLDGEGFPLPIFLSLDYKPPVGEKLNLFLGKTLLATLEVEDVYKIDLDKVKNKLFGGTSHPGYDIFIRNVKQYVVGGKLDYVEDASLKDKFREMGWKTVAGFQTRNVPHRGHEYIQEYALSLVDGLLLTPVLGLKKQGDFKNSVIKKVYEKYLGIKFPRREAQLHFLFLNMRYLGPKEAVFHAIVRKNLGCTHFIIGRDHAGANGIYGPYEAQEYASSFNLGIEIIRAKEVLWCNLCGPRFEEECNHEKVPFSGTKLREHVKNGTCPNFFRKELFDIIKGEMDPFINDPDNVEVAAFIQKFI